MADIAIRSVTKQYANGHVAIDGVDLDVADGELLVLVGPSGCGKSTLLRMVAGLEEVTDGAIAIGGRDVTDLAPKDRDIAMVFQSYALVSQPDRAREHRVPAQAGQAAVKRDRPPGPGSGAAPPARDASSTAVRRSCRVASGNAVAMGRAIVRQPRAFLMDEPLSNLDAKLRVQMRAEIATLQRDLGVTTIYVTHDQTEAMTMGSRVAVLDGGRIQQVDTPRTLYQRPGNLFVAAFIGSPAMNLYRARIATTDGGLTVAFGRYQLPVDDRVASECAEIRSWVGREVIVGIRPEAMEDASLDPTATPERVIELRVDLVEALGAELLAHATIDASAVDANSRFVARLSPRSRIEAGDTAKLTVDTSQLHLFDPVSGQSLRSGA